MMQLILEVYLAPVLLIISLTWFAWKALTSDRRKQKRSRNLNKKHDQRESLEIDDKLKRLYDFNNN